MKDLSMSREVGSTRILIVWRDFAFTMIPPGSNPSFRSVFIENLVYLFKMMLEVFCSQVDFGDSISCTQSVCPILDYR